MREENRKYGLLKGDWEKVISVFRSNPKIRKAVLFGSRAKGKYFPGSDVDIALMGEDLHLDDLLMVRTGIEKLSLPYGFDIVIYDRIRENAMKEHIDRVGKMLFEREEARQKHPDGTIVHDKKEEYGNRQRPDTFNT